MFSPIDDPLEDLAAADGSPEDRHLRLPARYGRDGFAPSVMYLCQRGIWPRISALTSMPA